MFSIFTNKKGQTTLVIVSAIALITGIGFVYLQPQINQMITRTTTNIKNLNLELLNKKQVTLGGYFISNNLVLCKSDGWDVVDPDEIRPRCIWGGDFHKDPIKKNKYNIINTRYDDGKMILEFDVDNVQTSELIYELVNWNDEPQLKTLLGDPFKNTNFDDLDADPFVVRITSLTSKMGPNDKLVTSKHVVGIRRPLGIIKVKILGDTSCFMSCASSVSENIFSPECRGPQEVPANITENKLDMKVINYGPGAIYRVRLKKNTIFTKKFFGKNKKPEYKLVDVIGAVEGANEVILPGQEYSFADSLNCRPPKYLPKKTVYGNANKTKVSVHGERTTTYTYDLPISNLHNENFYKTLSKQTEQKFNGPEDMLEPARLLERVNKTKGTTEQKYYTVIEVIAIPPH